MVNGLVIGGTYQHYKGMLYIVKGIVRHSETLEELVYYECQYENSLGKNWVRPLGMFLEMVKLDGKEVPRFKFLRD